MMRYFYVSVCLIALLLPMTSVAKKLADAGDIAESQPVPNERGSSNPANPDSQHEENRESTPAGLPESDDSSSATTGAGCHIYTTGTGSIFIAFLFFLVVGTFWRKRKTSLESDDNELKRDSVTNRSH